MPKKKLKLTSKELVSPWVSKLLINENEALKDSLKITQNAHEELRQKYSDADKKCAILNEKMNIHILLEILKVLLSIAIWYLTNIITNAFAAWKLIILLFCILWIIVLLVVQYKNKKN